jgi:peptidoglycan/LPS O-acetylase OafA/YrhL
MLLRRLIKPVDGKNTFIWCSVLLLVILSFPRVGGYEKLWLNGLFDSLSVIIVFPLIIYLGAIGEVRSKFSEKVCTFLGDISYPIYIIHFPFTYVFYAWVVNNNIPLVQGTLTGIALLIIMIILSYASLKLYDEPVRKWLSNRFIYQNKNATTSK